MYNNSNDGTSTATNDAATVDTKKDELIHVKCGDQQQQQQQQKQLNETESNSENSISLLLLKEVAQSQQLQLQQPFKHIENQNNLKHQQFSIFNNNPSGGNENRFLNFPMNDGAGELLRTTTDISQHQQQQQQQFINDVSIDFCYNFFLAFKVTNFLTSRNLLSFLK